MSADLEPVQEVLLRDLAKAARSLTFQQRQKFRYHHQLGADVRAVLDHPGLPEDTRVYLGDIEILQSEGLLIRSGNEHSGNFDLTPKGFRVAEGARATSSEPRPSSADPRKVWVVYGRNEAAKAAIFAFLRSLGLTPMEWDQAVKRTGKGSPFVGEVLDAAFSEAQAFLILLTGDDEARLREGYRVLSDPSSESALTPQPRLNVVFEAGMAFGSRHDRTIIVQIGDVKPFSDVAGRHVIHMDGSPERRNSLAERLKTAGCEVNMAGTDWLSAGDFRVAIRPFVSASAAPSAGSPIPPGRLHAALTPEDIRVLAWLAAHEPRSSTLAELANNLGGNEKVMLAVLNRLMDYGLVDAKTHSREGPRYVPTEYGRDFVKGEGYS